MILYNRNIIINNIFFILFLFKIFWLDFILIIRISSSIQVEIIKSGLCLHSIGLGAVKSLQMVESLRCKIHQWVGAIFLAINNVSFEILQGPDWISACCDHWAISQYSYLVYRFVHFIDWFVELIIVVFELSALNFVSVYFICGHVVNHFVNFTWTFSSHFFLFSFIILN